VKPGTKPKPTHLKLIEGNRGKRPINRKEAKTIPALPDPPPHLTADGLEEWRRVAGWLHKIGLLSEVDRAALAAYAQAYGRWVQAERAIAKMAEKDQLTGGLMINLLPLNLSRMRRIRALITALCAAIDLDRCGEYRP
jgi:phage terminase small subunit